MDAFQVITDEIIKLLEAGHVPWKKTWRSGRAPLNALTQKAYQGVNVWLLFALQEARCYQSNQWATFNQITKLGGRVKAGAKSAPIVYYEMRRITKRKADGTDKEESFPMLKMYRVFNLDQCENIQTKLLEPLGKDNQVIESCEEFTGRVRFKKIKGQPAYNPRTDEVLMPDITDFTDSTEYYAALFHELGHWTGAKGRLDREGVTKATKVFGDEDYSKEELIAELCSSFACANCGITKPELIKNTAAYIGGWLRSLKNDKRMIVTASSAATKAFTYLANPEPDNTPKLEEPMEVTA